jgi:peptidoglycan/LPS O-acetylase OafA/YrhL
MLTSNADAAPALPAPARLAGPDHLRAIAISLVLLFHYRLFAHPAWFDAAFAFCWTGVDLFFVLSGFLIASQLFKEINRTNSFALKPYFIRRFFRIIPAYAAVLCLYFLVPPFREWEQLPPLWRFLSFTQNINLDRSVFRTFSHVWSLCVEEQFYIVFPFFLLLVLSLKKGRMGGAFLLIFFVLGFAVRIFSWYYFVLPFAGSETFSSVWLNRIYYPTYNRLDGLLCGIAIAGIWQFYPRVKKFLTHHANIILGTGFVLITASYFVCIDQESFAASVFGFPLIAISFACLLIAAISPSCILYRIKSRFTSWLADLSYSLYLSHKGLIHLTQQRAALFGIKADGVAMFFICLLVCICGAFVLRYLAEKPFMLLKDKILKTERK